MKNIKIAVTGGIGSGKSAVCEIIKNLGFPVFSCDEVYAELLRDEAFVQAVSELVGVLTSRKDGHIVFDRRAVSDKIFTNGELKKKLDNFTHPVIMKTLLRKMNAFVSGPVFAEVPLLFEGGFTELFDKVIVVVRPMEDRISSVEKRSGMSRQEVLSRIKNQFDYENYRETAHTLIYNDSDFEELKKKVSAALRDIVK